MTTWAQVINGVVLNPVTKPPAQCFVAEWLAGKTFVVVDDVDKDGNVLSHGATVVGGVYTNPAPAPVPKKRSGLTWEEFRKLFTDAELEALDSYDMTGCPVALTDAQKIKIRAFIKKGEARGADRLIDVTTPGIAAALGYLEARGFIDATGNVRKNEIIAGVVKS